MLTLINFVNEHRYREFSGIVCSSLPATLRRHTFLDIEQCLRTNIFEKNLYCWQYNANLSH